MGNNEDSASFITTCSSIPDLTSRAPTSGIHPGSSPSLLSATPFLARARERDVSEAPGVCLALNHPVATRVPTPHPLRPLIFSRFRPTLAAYPGNALGSVIANRGTGLDIVRKVHRVRVYIYECARPRVWPLHRQRSSPHTVSACRLHERRAWLDRYRWPLKAQGRQRTLNSKGLKRSDIQILYNVFESLEKCQITIINWYKIIREESVMQFRKCDKFFMRSIEISYFN